MTKAIEGINELESWQATFPGNTAQEVIEIIAEQQEILKAAAHALRSYQFGNQSPDLAESVADKIDNSL